MSPVTQLLVTDLLVTEEAGTCPVPRHAGPWNRIMARVGHFPLDCDLAHGASPEASVRLALRARRLTGMPERRTFARAIRHLLYVAARPGRPGGPAVMVCRDRVRTAAREFEELADRLLSPAPVAAHGMAQTSMLLHDGRGPLYRRSSREDLPAQVHQAVASLDRLAHW